MCGTPRKDPVWKILFWSLWPVAWEQMTKTGDLEHSSKSCPVDCHHRHYWQPHPHLPRASNQFPIPFLPREYNGKGLFYFSNLQGLLFAYLVFLLPRLALNSLRVTLNSPYSPASNSQELRLQAHTTTSSCWRDVHALFFSMGSLSFL